MFLHLSVSHSVNGGGYLGRYTPGQVHPQAGTPQWQVHLWAGTPPRAGTPTLAEEVRTARYGQQTGGTHPTGMHSCFS